MLRYDNFCLYCQSILVKFLICINVFYCYRSIGHAKQLQWAQYVRVFAVRRRMWRVHRRKSLYSVFKLGTPFDYTSAFVSHYRMPSISRVLYMEIWTPKSNYYLISTNFFFFNYQEIFGTIFYRVSLTTIIIILSIECYVLLTPIKHNTHFTHHIWRLLPLSLHEYLE